MEGVTELTLTFVAVFSDLPTGEPWGEDAQPSAEIHMGGNEYETQSASFSHEDRTMVVEGNWHFDLPTDLVEGSVMQLVIVRSNGDVGHGRELRVAELELLDRMNRSFDAQSGVL